MRKRDRRVEICFTKTELEILTKKIRKRHLLATVKANDMIRIYKDSFEAWYRTQKRHTIVTG